MDVNAKRLVTAGGAPLTRKEDINNDALISRCAPLPDGYKHVGITKMADGQLAIFVAGDGLEPRVWNAHDKVWVPLIVRSVPGGGFRMDVKGN